MGVFSWGYNRREKMFLDFALALSHQGGVDVLHHCYHNVKKIHQL